MAFNLKKQRISAYQPVTVKEIAAEEACDVIIPDSWPDAERICGSSATVTLRSKETMAGKAVINGNVKIHVIYQSYDNETKALSSVLPFSAELSDPAICETSVITAEPWIVSHDGKVINSRKLQMKATIVVKAAVMNESELEYCNEIESDSNIETLCGEYKVFSARENKEKSFTISDELQLDNGKPSFGQLLTYGVRLNVTDKKLVGTKMVFKGKAVIDTVYLTADGQVENGAFELPFSQIIDFENAEETDEPRLVLTMTGCEVEILDDYSENLRRLELNMNVLAQGAVCCEQTIKPLLDCYSTDYELTVETSPVKFETLLDNRSVTKNVREFISTSSQPIKVLAAQLNKSKLETVVEGGKAAACQNGEIVIEYMDADGIIKTEKKKIELRADLALAAGSNAHVFTHIQEPTATSSGSAVEFNADVEFEFLCTATIEPRIIAGAEATESVIDRKAMPSIVITKAKGDIWQLAKKHKAKQADILAANGLEEFIADERMILIPKPAGK